MSAQVNQFASPAQYPETQLNPQLIPNYYPKNITANQARELQQDMNYLLEADNCHDFRISQLEHQLRAKKKDETTIYPDQILETPGGMAMRLGSSSKYMPASNFHFVGAKMMIFPKPYEREAYYQVDLSIIGEEEKIALILSEKELTDYKSLNIILSKHGCYVLGASGKGDKKKVLALLADTFMSIASRNEFVIPALAGWTCEELIECGEENKYSGIGLHNETLALFNIGRKRLITTDKPDADIIRRFEEVFTDKKIYYFLVAWHIYSIVKNQLPDGVKSSLKRILNLNGRVGLSQKIALFIFKIFNRDNMHCDLTKRDNFAKIDETLLLARDETVIVSDFDATATRNEKNNTKQRLQYLESVICNEAPIRDKYKTTANCVLISNSVSEIIDASNLFQIHIDSRVINEENLALWELDTGDFCDLNSLLIRHINLTYGSFRDDITERYREQSNEMNGIFNNCETKGAYIVLRYMLKIYREAIITIDESAALDEKIYGRYIEEVLLANEGYQNGKTDSASESAMYVFKEALIRLIESDSCNIAEKNSNDEINTEKPTIYHDDEFFYVKEHVFKESICPLMTKTISGREILNILKSNKYLFTNNGSCLTARGTINSGQREYFVKVSRSFIDVRGEISYFD